MTKTLKIPAVLYRTGTSARNDDGEMELSISSDTPYLRYDWMNDEEYLEVLDHSPGGMDTTRLAAGAALLFNHDRNIQIGTISAPEMRSGKCFVKAKLSAAEDVKGYRTRVDEGILKDTSVGYRITDEGECIGAKDGLPIYKFKWAPHEASLVTIPADITVGVGRARALEMAANREIEFREVLAKLIDTPNKPVQERQQPAKLMAEIESSKPVEINVVDEQRKAVASERERVKKINDFVGAVKNPDPARDWKSAAAQVAMTSIEAGDDFDTFRAKALNSFEGVKPVEVESGDINMSKKELRRFSITELIRQSVSGKVDSFYKEKSADVAKVNKRDPEGIWIPDDVSGRSLQEIHGLGSRAMENTAHQMQQFSRALTVSPFSAGGALVGTDLLAGSLIQLLLNQVAFLNGFVYLGGLVGNVAIPKVTGGQTAYWLPEGGTVSGSNMTFAQLGLMPHRLVASTAYDKQLVAQASLGVEALVRDTIARVMAVEKNRAMINGSGASGEPLGLLNITGVQSNDTTANTPTWAQIVNFETKIGTANANLGAMSWLYSPAVQGNLKSLPKIGSTFPIFMQEGGMVNGYPVNITNNVPSGKGIFGVGSEFIVADWAGIDIVVNPYSLDTSGQIRVTVQQWTDNGCRHEVAFVVSDDTMAAA